MNESIDVSPSCYIPWPTDFSCSTTFEVHSVIFQLIMSLGTSITIFSFNLATLCLLKSIWKQQKQLKVFK